jgi:tripartite-type tricarboxylate transporter receptor subunit TctC
MTFQKSGRAALAIAMLLFCALAVAQDSSRRPLRLVTMYAPGGASDDTARFLTAKFSEILKVPVIVENKGGAGGLLATLDVLRSQPLGSAMLLGHPALVANLFALKNPQYKLSDFTALGVIGIADYALIIHTMVPAKNLREFVAYAKANPDKLNYGALSAAGVSTILAERLKEAAGINMTQIPFKGGGPAAVALLAGQIQVYFPVTSVARQRLQNKQIAALAVTGEKRSNLLPDVPTFSELGYTALSGLAFWDGVFAPSAAPAQTLAPLRAAMATISSSPEMQARRIRLERDPWEGSMLEFEAYIRRSGEMLEADFRKLNIQQMD